MVALSSRPWVVAPRAPAGLFATLPDLHPVAVQVLFNRGLKTAAEVRTFLDSAGARLHDPRQLYGMDRAIARLRRAIAGGETIVAHGDFDVDGVTATAVLAEGLGAAGARVVPYVPQRTSVGYGVQAGALEQLAAQGASLIVTGDTGTRAHEAVARATELGLDVIVTDHHVPGDRLPDALAVVNPLQPACPYPFKSLSGVGVAWKLVYALALEGYFAPALAERLLDLVALGTIVDVSPLVGENRTLVQRGLRCLGEAARPGIRALLAKSASTRGGPVDERTVSFTLGPRLNAAGRMDDAGLALELLTTADVGRAGELVLLLEQKNQERRQLTEQVLVAARQQAEQVAHQPVLVLRGEGWPGGVIGLVAARLADEYGRPAVIVDVRPDGCRGSGRSVDGFDLVTALTGCADLLLEYGGHTSAAGFAILPDRLDALVERLLDAAAQQRLGEPRPVVADYALAQHELNDWSLFNSLKPLRPFGAGNEEPVFLTAGLPVVDARTVGEGGRHLKARVRFGRQTLSAFGPDLGAWASKISGGRIDALYTIQVSSWGGYDSLELKLQDVRPASQVIDNP
jgi:single-stranded-DNA-specific exonuclease